MSDLRKPFYDYAMREQRRRFYGKPDCEPSGGAAWCFAEWALEFMSDAEPERAFEAYAKARR